MMDGQTGANASTCLTLADKMDSKICVSHSYNSFGVGMCVCAGFTLMKPAITNGEAGLHGRRGRRQLRSRRASSCSPPTTKHQFTLSVISQWPDGGEKYWMDACMHDQESLSDFRLENRFISYTRLLHHHHLYSW